MIKRIDMGPTRAALAGAFVTLLLAGAAVAADGPPTLDVESTCRSAARAEVATTGREESVAGCLRSERGALDEARRRWGDYSAAAKGQCSRQSEAGGSPSYVEMVTCLELASGTAPTPQKGAGGPAPEGKASGNLSPEANPNQRTNPIEVLGQPYP